MRSQIVHDDDVAALEGRHEELLDISQKAFTVDWAIKDTWRIDPVRAERGKESQGAPFAMRRFGDQPAAKRRPAPQGGHVGFAPGLIDKDQPGWVKTALMRFPAPTLMGDVGTILLAGEQSFF